MTRTPTLLKTTFATAVLAIGTMTFAEQEREQEERIDLKAAPAAVQAAITKAIGGHKLEKLTKETENGKTVYEAEFEIGKSDHSIKVGEAGNVIEEESEIDVKSLPAAVTKEVHQKYPGAKISQATEVKADGKTFFALEIKAGKEERELKVDAAGKILSDEASDEGEGEHEHQDNDKEGKEGK